METGGVVLGENVLATVCAVAFSKCVNCSGILANDATEYICSNTLCRYIYTSETAHVMRVIGK